MARPALDRRRSASRMSIWTANQAHPRRRLLDLVFVGGCTGAYVILIGAVLTALKLYGG
jgi:hypothetical protein